jgi:hypothetical protein
VKYTLNFLFHSDNELQVRHTKVCIEVGHETCLHILYETFFIYDQLQTWRRCYSLRLCLENLAQSKSALVETRTEMGY